jgi:hypothetical protein
MMFVMRLLLILYAIDDGLSEAGITSRHVRRSLLTILCIEAVVCARREAIDVT